MKRSYIIGGIAAAAALVVGGVGIDLVLTGGGDMPNVAYGATPPTARAAPAARAALGTAKLALGTALVDGSGRALYLFEADQGSTSVCNGPCAQVWPAAPGLGAAPAVTGAATAGLVGSTTRADGSTQLTYAGHPLYYFAGDKAPGDVRGQDINNFGGSWYVVDPAGHKIDPDEADAPAPGY